MNSGLILFLCLVAAGAFVTWIAWRARNAKLAREDAERGLRRDEVDAKSRASEYERSFDADWPVRWQTDGTWYRWYLMMSADQRRLRFHRVKFRPYLEVREDTIIDVQAIVSIEVQQSSTTVMKIESANVTTRKGALGRAAVGGMLAGGAGAVVGAVSAPSKTTGTMTATSKTKKGPISLNIGTTDVQSPLLKIQLPTMGVAETWLHRIRSAMQGAASDD